MFDFLGSKGEKKEGKKKTNCYYDTDMAVMITEIDSIGKEENEEIEITGTSVFLVLSVQTLELLQ